MLEGKQMILSFSVFKEKIESGEKKQTIRKYSAKQYQRFLNTWKKRETTGRYNLYWHNPRNGGVKMKDVVPSDNPYCIRFDTEWGIVNTGYELGHNEFVLDASEREQLAKDDGFPNFVAMLGWFMHEYNESLYKEKFIVIRWL